MTENNKEVLELYKKLWSEIKKQIKAINSGESIKYKNDFMKIRFSILDMLCKSAFQFENEYYLQIHINVCEYECEY